MNNSRFSALKHIACNLRAMKSSDGNTIPESMPDRLIMEIWDSMSGSNDQDIIDAIVGDLIDDKVEAIKIDYQSYRKFCEILVCAYIENIEVENCINSLRSNSVNNADNQTIFTWWMEAGKKI